MATTPSTVVDLDRDDTHRRYVWFHALAGRLVRIEVELPDGRRPRAAVEVMSEVTTWTPLLDATPARRADTGTADERRAADFAAAQLLADGLAARAARILAAAAAPARLVAA